MKKFGLLALMAVLLLGACNRDEGVNPTPSSPDKTDVVANHFYGVKRSNVAPTIEKQGIAQRTNLWYPCSIITVKLLDDPYNMKEKIKTYAKEWEQYAGITFKFVDSGDAFVRIGFDWNDNRYITWSYVGTDCKNNTNQSDATISYAYWDSSTEQERKADVLRTFGQVLGLELEHRHLTFNPGWTSRISQYWTGEITDMVWADLKKYVFDPLDAANVIQTPDYDANSIMVWPFSSRYAANTAREFNYELSATDKAFIGQLYPKSACDDGAIVTMKTSKQSIRLKLGTNSDVVVDWGDGIRESKVASTAFFTVEHTYTNVVEHTIKLYGSTEALVALFAENDKLTMLDVSKNLKLELLACGVNELTSIDLSKNTQLDYLDCSYNPITMLDVSKNVLLAQLLCGLCELSNLDVSNNLNLISLHCTQNKLTSLDVSKNLRLHHLVCLNNQLTTLDVSKNVAMTMLNCGNNKIGNLDVSRSIYLRELRCDSNLLTELSVTNNVELENLYCERNRLPDITIAPNGKLRWLHCSGNPLVTNQTVLVQLVQSLPNRTITEAGALGLYNSVSAGWVTSICTVKNWTVYY